MPLAISSSCSGHAWDAYVDAHPRATGYHLWGWRLPLEQVFGHRWLSLVAAEGERVRGLLPLVLVQRRPLRPQIVTGPFGAYAGAIGDSPAIESALYEQAIQLARQQRASFLLVKTIDEHPVLRGAGWRLHPNHSHSCLDLPQDPDQLWRSVRSEIRNRVRKAEKHGLTVRPGAAHLDGFYRAYAGRMHDLGSPVQPKRFFEATLEGLGQRAELYTVWHADEVVGGALYFSCRGTAYVPWLGCERRYFGHGIYQLLYWSILREICGRETVFDFGRSTLSKDQRSGTQTAKERWGARTTPVYHFHFSPAGRDASPPEPDGRLGTYFTATWKRLPRPVATALGSTFIRYFVAY